MNAFSPEKRESIESRMIEEGFSMLKAGGLRNICIEEIARKCGVAKGSFYSFFDTKTAFIYRIMVAKREEAKRKLQDHLQDGKLSFDGLYQYLLWLAQSDLDIFAHLSEKEQQELKRQWPASWLNNDSNNILTVSRILDCLEKPRQDADKLLFANCLKLISVARAEKQMFASTAFEQMIESIVRLACETVCISSRKDDLTA